jgi:dephospho-CoA kinase
VETLDAQKKRMPAFGTDKIISLADIAMYTDEKEVPLRQVFKNIYDMEGGKPAVLDYRKASTEELADFMAKALPNYDRDHVYPSDMKKLLQWYNILVENGITDFEEAKQEEQEGE